jgi:hypothetical protein
VDEPGREPLRVAFNRLRCPPKKISTARSLRQAEGRELAEALHDRHLDPWRESEATKLESCQWALAHVSRGTVSKAPREPTKGTQLPLSVLLSPKQPLKRGAHGAESRSSSSWHGHVARDARCLRRA